MNKTMIINIDYFNPTGDVLDVTTEKCGVIYSYAKGIEDEISIDYVDEDNKAILEKRRYDACTFFFNINSIGSSRKKEQIIREVNTYLKKNGEIYIWDINKDRGEIIDRKMKILISNNKFKETTIKNLNFLCECNCEEIEKIVSKYYIIEECRVWSDMFYIRAKKKD